MSETTAKPKVAFLGLGLMGAGMADRLLAAGFPLTVYNRNREKCIAFESAGAYVAGTPHEAASRAQIVFSMVADDTASRNIWLGENGVLAGASPNSLLIECSTLTGEWIHELAAKAAERGCKFLDAPVTGSKPQAAAGELLFLVGGSAEALDEARPALSVLSRNTVHLGPTGSGSLMKLINNFLCGVQAASMSEALAMIDKGELDRGKALSILTSGAPGSGIVKRVSDKVASQDFTPNFALRWMAKDISYSMKEAASQNISLQTAAAALSIFQRAISEGHGDDDFSAVTKASAKSNS
jgi:3-hydroxyisobutyrate dehydrogenase